MLESLSEKPRRVLKLAKIDGLSLAEVAERTGLSTAAVKVIVHGRSKNYGRRSPMKTEELILRLSREAKPARRPLVGLWVAAAIVAGVAVVAAPLAVFHAPSGGPTCPRGSSARVSSLRRRFGWRRRSRPSRSPPGWPSPVFGGAETPAGPSSPFRASRRLCFCAGRSQGPVGRRNGLSAGEDAARSFMGWASSGGAPGVGRRRAAPTRLAAEGFWIAFGSGALISFVMQFVCPMENIAHIVLWHSVPVALLALPGSSWEENP